MTINPINQTPYLRTSRLFPPEIGQLIVEVNRAYIDIALSVNDRTIGIYPEKKYAITGNEYYISSEKQQSVRQIYSFGAIAVGGTLSIPVDLQNLTQYTQIYGTCISDDGSGNPKNYKPIPYPSVTANANIECYVDIATTSIVINVGASVPDAILSGMIVLEWIFDK